MVAITIRDRWGKYMKKLEIVILTVLLLMFSAEVILANTESGNIIHDAEFVNDGYQT